jgi:hypothetical protein
MACVDALPAWLPGDALQRCGERSRSPSRVTVMKVAVQGAHRRTKSSLVPVLVVAKSERRLKTRSFDCPRSLMSSGSGSGGADDAPVAARPRLRSVDVPLAQSTADEFPLDPALEAVLMQQFGDYGVQGSTAQQRPHHHQRQQHQHQQQQQQKHQQQQHEELLVSGRVQAKHRRSQSVRFDPPALSAEKELELCVADFDFSRDEAESAFHNALMFCRRKGGLTTIAERS